MAVEKQAYREAMARLGAAVNVITTDGPGGRAGFTASAVCSVTDTPPTLLVCANRTNDSYPAMKANAVLCVNTLAGAHEELSPVFAGLTDHTMAARFEGATWHTLLSGAPVLDGALVAFDCRIDADRRGRDARRVHLHRGGGGGRPHARGADLLRPRLSPHRARLRQSAPSPPPFAGEGCRVSHTPCVAPLGTSP